MVTDGDEFRKHVQATNQTNDSLESSAMRSEMESSTKTPIKEGTPYRRTVFKHASTIDDAMVHPVNHNLLHRSVGEIAKYAYGVAAVEVWFVLDDQDVLVQPPGGYWRDPASEFNDAIARLEDKSRPDYEPPARLRPGEGVAGALWWMASSGARDENLLKTLVKHKGRNYHWRKPSWGDTHNHNNNNNKNNLTNRSTRSIFSHGSSHRRGQSDDFRRSSHLGEVEGTTLSGKFFAAIFGNNTNNNNNESTRSGKVFTVDNESTRSGRIFGKFSRSNRNLAATQELDFTETTKEPAVVTTTPDSELTKPRHRRVRTTGDVTYIEDNKEVKPNFTPTRIDQNKTDQPDDVTLDSRLKEIQMITDNDAPLDDDDPLDNDDNLTSNLQVRDLRKVVWCDIRTFALDPLQPPNVRMELLYRAGYTHVAGVTFSIRGHQGIVVYFTRMSNTNELQKEIHNDYLRSAADLMGAEAALMVTRTAVLEYQQQQAELERQKHELLVLNIEEGLTTVGEIQGAESRDSLDEPHSVHLSSIADMKASFNHRKVLLKLNCCQQQLAEFQKWKLKCKGMGLNPPPSMPNRQVAFTAVAVFATMFLVALLGHTSRYFFNSSPFFLPLGPMGAVMSLTYGLPAAPLGQPRNIILGQCIGMLTGIALNYALPIAFVSYSLSVLRTAIVATVAISMQVKCGVLHPPASKFDLI